MQHEDELEQQGLGLWKDRMAYLAEKYVQDPSDGSLILPKTYDLYTDCLGAYMEEVDSMCGDYVKTEDFKALAERFVLAWELIKELEKKEQGA